MPDLRVCARRLTARQVVSGRLPGMTYNKAKLYKECLMIVYDEQNQTFTLHTCNTTYQMKVDHYQVLVHTYYGPYVGDNSLSHCLRCADRDFSPNPNEAGNDRTYSLDIIPQEYSTCGVGDFRLPSVEPELPDGSHTLDLRYLGYTLQKGKYTLPDRSPDHQQGKGNGPPAPVRFSLSGFSSGRHGSDHLQCPSSDGTLS